MAHIICPVRLDVGVVGTVAHGDIPVRKADENDVLTTAKIAQVQGVILASFELPDAMGITSEKELICHGVPLLVIPRFDPVLQIQVQDVELQSLVLHPVKSRMADSTKRRLEQLRQMTLDGLFGDEAKENAERLAHISPGVQFALHYIEDSYNGGIDSEYQGLIDLFVQYIIFAYRESKRKYPEAADALFKSLINDYPNIPDTCVYPALESLLRASGAFKAVLPSKNYLAVQQQSLKVAQAYNEFLNKVIGFIFAAVRSVEGIPPSKTLFNDSYADKLKKFAELTGGEEGVYYLLFRIAKPDLRNAIAHETIWFDREHDLVKFTNKGVESEMSIIDYMAFVGIGSNLPFGYLAAIGALIVLEEGAAEDIRKLPSHIVKVFNHRAT